MDEKIMFVCEWDMFEFICCPKSQQAKPETLHDLPKFQQFLKCLLIFIIICGMHFEMFILCEELFLVRSQKSKIIWELMAY